MAVFSGAIGLIPAFILSYLVPVGAWLWLRVRHKAGFIPLAVGMVG